MTAAEMRVCCRIFFAAGATEAVSLSAGEPATSVVAEWRDANARLWDAVADAVAAAVANDMQAVVAPAVLAADAWSDDTGTPRGAECL
jgi:hypothetical protein